MNKIIKYGALGAIVVVSYSIGKYHSHEAHSHESEELIFSEDNKKLADFDKRESTLPGTASKAAAEPSYNSMPVKARTENHEKNEANIEASVQEKRRQDVEELYPHYFTNDFTQLSDKDVLYKRAVESIGKENGVSNWGKARLGLIQDSIAQSSLMAQEVDCRISTCLVTGYADAKEDVDALFETILEEEEWGVHYNYKTLSNGEVVFFISLYD